MIEVMPVISNVVFVLVGWLAGMGTRDLVTRATLLVAARRRGVTRLG